MTRDCLTHRSQFPEISCGLLRDGKTVRFQAKGLSMQPSIYDGDYLHVDPVPFNSLRLGDIVFGSYDKNKIIVHRVVWLHKKGARPSLLVRGDATSGACETIEAENLLGRISRIDRNGKIIQMNSPAQKLRSLLYILAAPFMIWVFPTLSRIKNNRFFSRP